jgi:hypothetical protein
LGEAKKELPEYQEMHWKRAFGNVENPNRRNIINIIVYEDFRMHFAKKWQKPPRKALGFSVKIDASPRHRKINLSLGKQHSEK